MLAAVCSREQEGMCELLTDTQNGITSLCNSPLIDPRSKKAWFPLTLSYSQTSGLEQWSCSELFQKTVLECPLILP